MTSSSDVVAHARPGVGARDLVIALSLGALGLPGLVPGAGGEPDPLAATCWIALIAPAAGYAAGATVAPTSGVAPPGAVIVAAFFSSLT